VLCAACQYPRSPLAASRFCSFALLVSRFFGSGGSLNADDLQSRVRAAGDAVMIMRHYSLATSVMIMRHYALATSVMIMRHYALATSVMIMRHYALATSVFVASTRRFMQH
jgi:hypothetical protein